MERRLYNRLYFVVTEKTCSKKTVDNMRAEMNHFTLIIEVLVATYYTSHDLNHLFFEAFCLDEL